MSNKKDRISPAQLKHLLEHLSTATDESPLMHMYRAMICDALLDLRDAIGDTAKLGWYVRRMDAGLKELQRKILDSHAKQEITSEIARALCHTLDWADEHPGKHIRTDAMAPLTGDEEP